MMECWRTLARSCMGVCGPFFFFEPTLSAVEKSNLLNTTEPSPLATAGRPPGDAIPSARGVATIAFFLAASSARSLAFSFLPFLSPFGRARAGASLELRFPLSCREYGVK